MTNETDQNPVRSRISAVNDDDNDTPSSRSGASKMAAMRKRRFKKKEEDGAAPSPTTTTPVDTTEQPPVPVVETVPPENDGENEMDMEARSRAEAQARRQRILDAASDRMDRVEGLNRDDEDERSAAAAARDAKIAAFRKRRFKKSAAAAADAAGGGGSSTTKAIVEDAALPATNEDDDTATNTAAAAPTTNVLSDVNNSESDMDVSESGIKYVGVAKMRRRKILEQRREGQQVASAPTTTTHYDAKKKTRSSLVRNVIPIMMHALTALLLFAAGLDVGLQKYDTVVVTKVDYELSPVMREWPWSRHHHNVPDDATVSPLEDIHRLPHLDILDEFAADVGDDEDDNKAANVDPLFGVDLDELTAGPGVLMMLARRAVATHRLLLSCIYYGPKSMVTRVYNMIAQLFVTPPLLMLVAVAIRQLLGKTVLGAHLPDKKAGSAADGGIGGGTDIVGMIKNIIGKFVGAAFPTAVRAYDVWTHLRSDMYVVLLGLLVGLVYRYHHDSTVATTVQESLAASIGDAMHEATTVTVDGDKSTMEMMPDTSITDEL